jgi:hypothetical protein
LGILLQLVINNGSLILDRVTQLGNNVDILNQTLIDFMVVDNARYTTQQNQINSIIEVDNSQNGTLLDLQNQITSNLNQINAIIEVDKSQNTTLSSLQSQITQANNTLISQQAQITANRALIDALNATIISQQAQITANTNRNSTTVNGYTIKVGTGTLSGGSGALTVSDGFIKANSIVFYAVQPTTAPVGRLYVSAKSNGAFTITSTSGSTDNGVQVGYTIYSL